MNLTPIPIITLSEALPAPPSAQALTTQEDTHDNTSQLQDLQQQQTYPQQMAWTSEQKLMDEITTMFGPHLVEIAMKQDTVHPSDSSHEQQCAQGQPISPCNNRLFSSCDSSTDAGSACVATMLVPGLEPRAVNLSHANGIFSAICLAWLQELKIVYRCCGFLSKGPGVGEGGISKACFLDAAAFSPLARRWSWTSEDQEKGEDEVDEEEAAVVDFSHCVTMEVLWIEDLDRNGKPHRLRSWRNSVKGLLALNGADDNSNREDCETEGVLPFPRDQGLILPGRLKSLTMVGLSANKFNFGWLRATPRLETLNIHGMRLQGFDDAQLPPLPATTLWDLDGVFLPRLQFFSIHHAPVQQFRFEVLKHCPQLVFLDIRDLSPSGIREALVYSDGERGTTPAPGSGGCGTSVGGDEGKKFMLATKITTCRFEFLARQQHNIYQIHGKGTTAASRGDDFAKGVIPGAEMVKLLERYFPRLTHLYLDGVPAKLAIAITSGPPDPRKQQPPRPPQQQHQRPKDVPEIMPTAAAVAFTAVESETTIDDVTSRRAAELPWLKSVLLTREKVTVQEVLEYTLVPYMSDDNEGGDIEESLLRDSIMGQLGMKKHSVQYTFGTKTWQRIVS